MAFWTNFDNFESMWRMNSFYNFVKGGGVENSHHNISYGESMMYKKN